MTGGDLDLSAEAWARILERDRRRAQDISDKMSAEMPSAIAREPECAKRREVAADRIATIRPAEGPAFWVAHHNRDFDLKETN